MARNYRYKQQQKIRDELRNRIRSGDTGYDTATRNTAFLENEKNEYLTSAESIKSSNSAKSADDVKTKVDSECNKERSCKKVARSNKKAKNKKKKRDKKKPKGKNRFLHRRAWLIIVVIIACFVALAISSFSSKDPGILEVGVQGMLDAFSVTKDQSSENLVVKSDVSWQGRYSNELPEGYDEEIGLGSDASVAVSNNGQAIGYTNDAGLSETVDEIQQHLLDKGWTFVPSGQESAATFVKDTGKFRWLAVTCASFGDETSVVLVPEELQSSDEEQATDK